MSVKAISRGVRISPRKVSPVAALVRNRTVEDALVILEHTPRRAALAVKKTIESARANADYNHGLKSDSLKITEITVTSGPRYKRFRPVARGAAHPYQLRSSHITVVVDGEARPKAKAKVAGKSKAKTPAAKKTTTKKEAK